MVDKLTWPCGPGVKSIPCQPDTYFFKLFVVIMIVDTETKN